MRYLIFQTLGVLGCAILLTIWYSLTRIFSELSHIMSPSYATPTRDRIVSRLDVIDHYIAYILLTDSYDNAPPQQDSVLMLVE
jgi:hypothetical protein